MLARLKASESAFMKSAATIVRQAVVQVAHKTGIPDSAVREMNIHELVEQFKKHPCDMTKEACRCLKDPDSKQAQAIYKEFYLDTM